MHIRKFWLLFAQTTTVALGVLFIIALFKPDLLRWQAQAPSLTIQQAAQPASRTPTPVESFAPAAQKVIPSVVNVFTQQKVSSPAHPALQDPIFRYFFGDRLDARPREVSNLGSGVIISPNGYILTNHHVAGRATRIMIRLADRQEVRATLVGTDPLCDLAILKIDKKDLRGVVDIQLRRLEKLLSDLELKLELSEKAKAQIVELGYEPAFGARPVKRVILKKLQDPLAENILTGGYTDKSTIAVDVTGEDFTFEKK